MVDSLDITPNERQLSYLPLHVFERAYVECVSMVGVTHVFFAGRRLRFSKTSSAVRRSSSRFLVFGSSSSRACSRTSRKKLDFLFKIPI